tara:strand:+ start:215 stop:652 length:438 start_codon:yes stop_codon:yes gene_type:complete
MKLLISEVLQKVSNAKTKPEKIKLLQEYNSDALRMLLIWNFDESVISELPIGEVPYEKNEAPIGTEHTMLEKESRLFYNFVQGGNNGLTQTRRENMFIQLLEGLHKDEANVVCMVKDKKLGKKYKITRACVTEAFPQINWGGRTA